MSRFLILATLLASFVAQAELVTTKFKARYTLTKANGKTKKLISTRVFITHEDNVSVFNPQAIEDCRFQVGKQDLLSVFAEADIHECMNLKDKVIVSENAMMDLFYRTAMFSLSNKNIDRVYNFFTQGGQLINETLRADNYLLGIISDISYAFSRGDSVSVINLNKKTKFTLKDGRDLEQMTVELTPVEVIYPE